MKQLVLLMLFVGLVFSGCVPKFKPYPVKCIVPETQCASLEALRYMKDSEVCLEMKRCVEAYKENAKVCQ